MLIQLSIVALVLVIALLVGIFAVAFTRARGTRTGKEPETFVAGALLAVAAILLPRLVEEARHRAAQRGR